MGAPLTWNRLAEYRAVDLYVFFMDRLGLFHYFRSTLPLK